MISKRILKNKQQKYNHYKDELLGEMYKLHGKQIEDPTKELHTNITVPQNVDLVELGEPDDIKGKYIVSGARKLCVLGVIKYHQINHNLFEDSRLHPEDQKSLEKLHYLVEHNLPVKKRLLFEQVPELFRFEINKLQYEDKLLYNTNEKGYVRADGTIYEVDQTYNKKMLLSHQDSFFNKIMTMEHYLLEQSIDIYHTYNSKINDYLLRNNYAGFQDYFNQLKVMDKDKMMPWEKGFMDELAELRGIKEDIQTLLMKKYIEDEKRIEVDEWIRTPEVKEHILKEIAYMRKYQTIDILDTMLIPTAPATGPSFEERLRLATGGKIDDFIEEERTEFKKLADSRTPSPRRDLDKKDDDLI